MRNQNFFAAALIGFLLTFAVAYKSEAAQPKSVANQHVSNENFTGTVTFTQPVVENATGYIDYNFPALGGNSAVCAESFPITVSPAGLAQPGMFCLATPASDGGSFIATPDDAVVQCRISAANTAVIRLCSLKNDAGTSQLDMADSGWNVRTFQR